MSFLRRTLRRRPVHPGRLVLAALVAIALGPSIDAPAQTATEPSSGLEHIGTLDRFPPEAFAAFGDGIWPEAYADPNANRERKFRYNGTIAVFPEVRQLWQVYYTESFGTTTHVLVRHLDTLAVLRTFSLNVILSDEYNKSLRFAVDHARGRVFFVTFNSMSLVEVDFSTFAVRTYPLGPVRMDVAGFRMAGLEYDPHDNALVALFGQYSSASVANFHNVVVKIGVGTGEILQARQLRACTGPFPGADVVGKHPTPFLLTAQHVYLPCSRAGNSAIVVRLDRQDLYVPGGAETVIVGPLDLYESLVDRTGGRIILMTGGGELWSFDIASMSFVGVAGFWSTNGFFGSGIDPASGRLFFLTESPGLGMIEGRFFPMPQPRLFPEHRSLGEERIWVDPPTRRVFVLKGDFGSRHRHYDVFRMDPPPRPPDPPDPDRNTVDRPEQPGVTESRYFANAGGFGTRVVLANGVVPVVPAPSLAKITPTAQVLSKYVKPKCGFTDRELIAGHVARTEYDAASTSAASEAVKVDERSKLDLDRPSRCDVSLNNNGEVFKGLFSVAPAVLDKGDEEPSRWTQGPVSCSTSEGGQVVEETRSDETGLAESNVSCPVPGGRLTASASAGLNGAVQVGRAYATTSVYRDAAGIHTEARSGAEDIDIANGLIRIAAIRSVARSTANGRPQATPMSTHEVVVRGVQLQGKELCPAAAPCDVRAVIDVLNRALSSRAEFRLAAGIDERLLRGTPKGALTAVQKSVERQASDKALIGDFTTEVPALELVVYQDNVDWGRARQLYQFAGVSTAATYNISLVPTGSGLGADDVPSLADVVNDGASDGPTSDGFLSGPVAVPPAEASSVTAEAGDGGGLAARIGAAVRAVARGLRLILFEPRHSILFAFAWVLLSLPFALGRRWRRLAAVRFE